MARTDPGLFTTGGVNSSGAEAINGAIEKTRRLARGFRDFHNYGLRILLAVDGARHYPNPDPPMLNSEEPTKGLSEPTHRLDTFTA